MLFIHNIFTSEEDMQYLNDYLEKIYWVLCPNSNLYIENKLPRVDLIRRYSNNIAIGTDSLSSNHKLSVLEEIKTISKAFPSISLEELISWATINGAKALGIDDKYGSIEIGKNPGLNLIKSLDLSNLNLTDNSQVEVLQ
ncbi:amidohydrolase family protein [Bacteroidota bacterium]